MTPGRPGPRPEPALVPGELRGYRQFQLRPDGLYPLVHSGCGPWDGRLQSARCATGARHPAPAADCRCGLYAWYRPDTSTVALGPASAVVSARGRCIMGDRGFRAASARIEAVALPALVRWNPAAASRARRMLAVQYPRTRIYRSRRQMVLDFPPHDVRALGIDPVPDHSRRYRAAAAWLWLGFVVLSYSLAALPRDVVTDTASHWWPLLVLLPVVWQVGLVWLLTRLMAQQKPDPPHFGTGAADPETGPR